MIYVPSNQEEFVAYLKLAKAEDTVILGKGNWLWPRTIIKRGVTLRGAEGNSPSDAKFIPKKGYAIRAYGCTFENFTIISDGGQGLSLEGDHNVVRNVHFLGGDRALGVSGTNNLVEDSLFAHCTGNGIDVNGGFIYLPEISDKPINLQTALRNPDKYTPSQNTILEDAYYNRDMKLTIRNCVGYKNGYAGGNFTGGFIKLVPGAGGVVLDGCKDYFSVNSYWFDFPSTTAFQIKNCLSVGAIINGIFLEGSRKIGEATASVNGCVVIGAKVGMFVSAFPNAIVEETVLAATETPLKAHGIKDNGKGNRLYTHVTNTEQPWGNTLIAMNPLTYRAHTVTWAPIEYDRSLDTRYHVGDPLTGTYFIDTEDNNISGPLEPETSTQVEKLSDVVNLPPIPELGLLLNPFFFEEVSAAYGELLYPQVAEPSCPPELLVELDDLRVLKNSLASVIGWFEDK